MHVTPHSPALLLTEAPLTLDPDWLDAEPGLIPPMWLDGPDLTPDSTILPFLLDRFLSIVRRHAPADHIAGTIGGRIIDDPCDAGMWHVDDGAGLRFVTTVHARPGAFCGHEFSDRPGALPSGVVAVFTTAQHRRPRVPAGRRVFLSATTYASRADAVLDCAVLEPLTAAAR